MSVSEADVSPTATTCILVTFLSAGCPPSENVVVAAAAAEAAARGNVHCKQEDHPVRHRHTHQHTDLGRHYESQ